MDVGGEIEIAGRKAGTVRGAWYPYTYPMNLTGHPALSMPCGRSAGGLPIGLQLAGRWYDDRWLLGVAALLERELRSGSAR
jgi:aspartyl-tRNA(Asn)/glutamyl-tRNA(Gln) amidotransferase subunit A